MSKYKVLIVEDELLVATDIEESLEILGYNVIDSVSTGKGAIDSVNKILPDIILMDIMLKGDMTGIEAATIIRKNHDVPIIYLTANADIATIEKAKVSLPYGYIIKPFTEKDLQTNIEIAKFKFASDIMAKMESDQFNSFFSDAGRDGKNTLIIEGERGLEKINPEDIYFIESKEGRSILHLSEEEANISKTIDELEKSLPDNIFVRVNQNNIINIQKIFLLKLPEVIIADKMNVITVDDDKNELLESKLKTKGTVTHD